MKNKKNIIKSILVFIAFVLLTFYFVFRNMNFTGLVDVVKKSNIYFILIGILCMGLYLVFEGFNIRRVLRSLGNKVSLGMAIKYSIVGFFFSSITPSSTGGQPLQIYYMSKDKIGISNSTITCLVCLASFQIVSISLALISILIEFKYMLFSPLSLKVMIAIGIFLNSCVLFFTLAALFSKKLIVYLVDFVIKVLKLFHYKKADKLKIQLDDQIKEYRKCALYLRQNKSIFVRTVLTTFCELICFHAVPYFVYRSLGLNSCSIVTFLAFEIILYISTSAIPSPGAVGVSEFNYMMIYKMLFPIELLSSSMILSRGISFYFYVTICGIFILSDYIIKHVKSRNVTNV